MYADDTNIIYASLDQDSIQSDINNISTWASDRLLKFYTEKCCVLHIGKNNAPNRTNNKILTLTETSVKRDLGIIMGPNLDFATYKQHYKQSQQNLRTIKKIL